MFRLFFRASATAAMLMACILILINSLFLQQPIIGLFTLFVYAASGGALIGPVVLPKQTKGLQTAVGVTTIIATLSIIGSIIYYVDSIYQMSCIALTIIIGIATTLFGRRSQMLESEEAQQESPSRNKINITLAGVTSITLLLAAWWSAILSTSITEAIRSPWLVLNPFVIISIALCLLLLGSLIKTSYAAGTVMSVAVLFSTLSIASFIYPIGFGFDPFIHRATVAHIAEFGTITPKPLYYIGQYVLELISVHAFTLPLHTTDTLLVPILAALIITTTAAASFGTLLKNKKSVTLLTIFLLPLSALTLTTPQSLAYIFTIALIFLSLPRLLEHENAPPFSLLALVTIAALVTHPLAGIPAAIYLFLIFIAKNRFVTGIAKKILLTLSVIAGAISLPLVFIIQAKQSGLDITFNISNILNTSLVDVSFFFSNRYSSIFDGLYLVIDNMLWILLLLAFVGIFYVERYKANRALHLPFIAAIIWLINYWLLSTTLEFSFLIEYERQNYAARLLTLTSIFLIPHAAIGLAGIINTLKDKPNILRLSVLILVALLGTANVYGAYPRHDNYARSAGFNVSEHDFDAAYAINTAAGESDYVVLANQAVSAAALEAFGFKKYYHNDIFYYPIPTGGILYQIYLKMADQEPTRERAIAAMDLTGVDTVYFVINDYWWKSNVIIEHAKSTADEWFSVGEGAATIFVYNRNN